ncbi:Putative zinc-finger [Natronincola peptidivorans]|uniref:Anti-sigma-W factor RsiW n=1 Tax=Natronincola peptidivorans TaxID=426128 RepID=A0A1H9Y573_9FIRM|nr:zf-HC2 domain-containing protein [Natronincola peptidivorans]SES63997.1 Putative zinc-finger [Natronincola peptidivorans]
MKCTFNHDWLQEYLDNTLTSVERLVLEEHVKGCPECRKELTELKLLLWEIEEMIDVDLPHEAVTVKAQVLSNIRELADCNSATVSFDIKSFVALQNSIIDNTTLFLKVMPGMQYVVNTSKKSAVKGTSVLKKYAAAALKNRTKTLLMRGSI